jgi:Fe-S-cluster-containing dehydrogenase component
MTTGFDRRELMGHLIRGSGSLLLLQLARPLSAAADSAHENLSGESSYGMGVQIDRCIGCGRCVEACKAENDVLREPFFFRTWVERYTIDTEGEAVVESPNGGIAGFEAIEESQTFLKSFFVPKLCNHCRKPPCVQVCPVGATFKSKDGVILVDKDYCIGCRYCIQACPYGARYLDPRTKTADKCTFCYHRLTKGLLPACVEVCPTQARVFGELGLRASPLRRLLKMSSVGVLKPYLNTDPVVYYTDLDGEVR